MKAIRLKTEFLNNPIGVDFQQPMLSWNCEDGIKQRAYRVVAKCNESILWDSGKVESDSMRVTYPESLCSRQRVEWSVTLWDENDAEGEPASAFFEMGLLERSDWRAKWISGDYKVDRKKRYPVDCFKKEFYIQDIKNARLYATACGLYEVCINGERVGDFVLAPGVTNFNKRVQYQTYDVTDLLKNGENRITASLADGLYRGSCGAWGLKNQYGAETKLLLQLELEMADGEREYVVTDGSWDWSCDGEISFADPKDGERVDARRSPTYSGRAKETVHSIIPTASNNVPLREKEIFTDPKLIITPSGKRVLDFGQNIAGYIRFSVNASAGQKLKLRFGELIDKRGEFTQANIQCSNDKITTPLQEIEYTARSGENQYKTKFAIFGFQYVLVEGDIEWKPEDFTAIAVYSDMEETLKFDCSHPLINKFVENTRWSAKNNHADIPTDCPTRERHGWTGDAQIFTNTAAYFFDYAAFARKYLRMLGDEQYRNGKITQIVPSGGVDSYMKWMDGSPGWSDAEILMPYRMWKICGDDGILKENYENMKRYADFLISRIGKWYPTAQPTGAVGKDKKYIVNFGQAYGEWAEPDDVHQMTWKDCAIPHPEVATAYTSYTLGLMSEISEFLGRSEDAAKYSAYSEKTKRGYRALSRGEKFSLDTDRQARLVRALYYELLDEKDREYANNRLLLALNNYGWRLGTGFLSTPLILYVLQKIDVEYAYRLLENEQMPGWLFMPKKGANTIWEAWEGTETQNGGIASLNHYSKGAVCEWIFSQMCGIKVAENNTYIVAPKVGGTLTHAFCEYNGIYGKVKSEWQREDGKTVYRITVPANAAARATLPDGEKILMPGEYEFSYEG